MADKNKKSRSGGPWKVSGVDRADGIGGRITVLDSSPKIELTPEARQALIADWRNELEKIQKGEGDGR